MGDTLLEIEGRFALSGRPIYLCGSRLRTGSSISDCFAPERCRRGGCFLEGTLSDPVALAAELTERAAMWEMPA